MPRMLGISHPPGLIDDVIVPPEAHGVRLISMGFFAREDQAVIWRGPMLHKALEQFLTDVYWGELDYLVVDMPPGTGDVSLSMSQFLPRAEVIVVTTPQPAAQRVAQRAAAMAEKVDLDVIGVVENMSWFTGDDGTRYELFGAGGGRGARRRARRAAARAGAAGARAARRRRRRPPDRGRGARRRGVAGVPRARRAARHRAQADPRSIIHSSESANPPDSDGVEQRGAERCAIDAAGIPPASRYPSRRAVVLADPVERRCMVAASALMMRSPGGSRSGARATSARQDHVDRSGALRVVGDDRVVVDAEQREHHRGDQPGAVLAGRALEHEREVGVDRDHSSTDTNCGAEVSRIEQ